MITLTVNTKEYLLGFECEVEAYEHIMNHLGIDHSATIWDEDTCQPLLAGYVLELLILDNNEVIEL